MPSRSPSPSAPRPTSRPGQKGGIGLFQLLGLGLLLMMVVFLLIIIIRSLFSAA